MNAKALEALLIPKNENATEGIGNVILGVGSVLAGYAIVILGISAAIKHDKNKSQKDNPINETTKINSEHIKNVESKCDLFSEEALKDIKKLLQNKKYLNTLRKSIADKLQIDINKVPTNFKPHIENYNPDKLVVMIDYDVISSLYDMSNNRNDLDFNKETFGYWINDIINPSLEKIISNLKGKYYCTEIGQKFIQFETTEDWKEYGLYIENRL